MSETRDLTPVVLALPGKLTDKTGGTLYDRHLIDALRGLGHPVEILELNGPFPEPNAAAVQRAIDRLADVPRDSVLVVDGLALGALPARGLRRIAAPLVAMLHHPLGLEPGLPASRAQTLIESERAALAYAAHIIVPSAHIARTVQDIFAIPESLITVARPGVTQAPPERAAFIRQPVDPPLILSVGLLHPRKGHDILLKALSRIIDLDWQAKIIGRAHDPEETATLHRMVAQFGLSERVRIAGEVPTHDLFEDYARATLFALATRYEGHGLVFDEAVQHGLPIVSCNVGAVPDTVPEGAGLLVPADNPAAFAAALRRMLNHTESRARQAQAAQIAARHLPGWPQTARAVSSVLTALHRDHPIK